MIPLLLGALLWFAWGWPIALAFAGGVALEAWLEQVRRRTAP